MSEPSTTDSPRRPDRTRTVRIYAGVGVAFWVVAAIVASQRGASSAAITAMAVLAAAIAVALLVGWFHEPTGAVIMLALAAASIAVGLLAHWDLAFWGMMLISVTGPLLLAAYLFDAARRDSRDADIAETSERAETSGPVGR